MMGRWIPVDISIVLAHLYVANPETFEFTFNKNDSELKGFSYLGLFSFRIMIHFLILKIMIRLIYGIITID